MTSFAPRPLTSFPPLYFLRAVSKRLPWNPLLAPFNQRFSMNIKNTFWQDARQGQITITVTKIIFSMDEKKQAPQRQGATIWMKKGCQTQSFAGWWPSRCWGYCDLNSHVNIKEIGRYRVSAVHMPMSGSFENREIPVIFLETCTFSKIVLHVLR